MNVIISYFVRAKAWQIMVVLLILFASFQYLYGNFSVENNHITVISIKLIIISFLVVFIGWLFSIGIFLNNKIENIIKPKMHMFYLAIIIQVMNYAFYMFYFFDRFIEDRNMQSIHFMMMQTSNFVAFFCMIYIMFFIAKNLVMAEENKIIKVSDYFKEFILLLFYAVGIWFIQPRINRIFND